MAMISFRTIWAVSALSLWSVKRAGRTHKKLAPVRPPGAVSGEDDLPEKASRRAASHGTLSPVTCYGQGNAHNFHRIAISATAAAPCPFRARPADTIPNKMNPAIYRRHRKLLFSGRRWRMRLVFWGGALAVGVVSVGFAALATQATHLFCGMLIAPWFALILTPSGFVLSAWVANRFFPGSQGSGIPQAIAARHMKDAQARSRLLSLKLT